MILFIDDEERHIDSHVQDLRLSGHKVSLLQNVDEALEFFEKNLPQIDLVILDIMMPAGTAFIDVDTMQGLRTGLFVYEKIRQKVSELPVIILTNVSEERLAERFRKEKKCWFLRKEEYLPFELTEYVGKILATNRN